MAVALHEGVTFAGRYRIVRCIAAGGMGAVYEVVHLETERRRALKVMLPHVLHSPELRERFKREAKVAAYVESEFIVDVFDAGVDEATEMPFMVMELLRGEELGKRLKRVRRLDYVEALSYLHQTAMALDKTHKASIVHRDLKPENIFLTEREDGPPRVKVLDFGVAKLLAEGAAASVSTTQVVGTPTYMAPEQFRTDVKVTPAADTYALGMVAYTMLVGAPYWQKEARQGNVFALIAAAMRGPSDPASTRSVTRGVELPPGFDAWFSIATAAEPSQRFPSAIALVRALAEVLGAPAISTTLPGLDRVSFLPLPPAPPLAALAPPEGPTLSGTTTLVGPGRVSAPPLSPLAGVASPASPTPVNLPTPAVHTSPTVMSLSAAETRRMTPWRRGPFAVAGAVLALVVAIAGGVALRARSRGAPPAGAATQGASAQVVATPLPPPAASSSTAPAAPPPVITRPTPARSASAAPSSTPKPGRPQPVYSRD